MQGPAARLAFAALVFLIGAATPHRASADAAVVRWQVENSFRLFTDPADTEVHRATYRSLGPDERDTPVLSSERALQRRHDDGWASTMFRKTCWNWKTNRYSCGEYDDYVNPAKHHVRADIKGVEDAANLTCTWLTSPQDGAGRRGDAVTQPCNEAVEFDVPYPEGLDVDVELGGVKVASTKVKVRDILVVAMGDSFGSGEGNPDIPVRFSRDRTADYGKSLLSPSLPGYPARIGDWRSIGDKTFISENARWMDQACHRSLYSHQLRAALQLAVEDPHRSVTFAGVACSGAEITDGLFLRYKGNEWVPNPPNLSQVSAIAEVQCSKHDTEALDLPEAYHINGRIPELKGGLVLRKCRQDQARKIDLVMLSIGGNDIGFSRLVANAVLSSGSQLRALGGWMGQVHGQAEATAQLDTLAARYKSMNRAIHSLLYVPWDESDRILMASYPGMALTGDGSETCKDGRAGMEVVSDFALSEQKLREGTWIADKLHRAMRSSAELYGWSFVETHRRAFIDRGVCSGVSYDGGNLADDLRLPRKVGGVWKPYNPADFRPYASRQRWFRTPNDAFMTGNFHVATSLLQKVLKLDALASFQLLLAATYSGAFHPTAEGHAAIADAVAQKARVVLQKYGQGPDSEQDASEPDSAPVAEEPGATIPDIKAVIITPAAAPAAGSDAAKPPADAKPPLQANEPVAAPTPSPAATAPVQADEPAAEPTRARQPAPASVPAHERRSAPPEAQAPPAAAAAVEPPPPPAAPAQPRDSPAAAVGTPMTPEVSPGSQLEPLPPLEEASPQRQQPPPASGDAPAGWTVSPRGKDMSGGRSSGSEPLPPVSGEAADGWAGETTGAIPDDGSSTGAPVARDDAARPIEPVPSAAQERRPFAPPSSAATSP